MGKPLLVSTQTHKLCWVCNVIGIFKLQRTPKNARLPAHGEYHHGVRMEEQLHAYGLVWSSPNYNECLVRRAKRVILVSDVAQAPMKMAHP